eukprot:SAG11_NODE_2102_length_3820_cov_2.233808_7_plen_137_part_00
MGGGKVGAEERGAPISGYCGFQPGVSAGNVFGADFVKQQALAASHGAALSEAATVSANPAYGGACACNCPRTPSVLVGARLRKSSLGDIRSCFEVFDDAPRTDGGYLRESMRGRQFVDKAPYPEVLRRADRRIAKV